MSDLQSGKSLIAIAIDASITVLDTMNPNDKVGVVAFSSIVKLPPMIGDTSCYANELALSTTINIQNLKKFVLSLTASGGTNYGKAFEAAFNLLKASYTPDVDIERDQVIIFLTDGEPTDTKASIMSTIRSKNEEMENKVTILTFGLGSDSGINFLQDIANQNFVKHGVEEANISIGETKQGVFTHVTDYNLLRSKMARYYDYFANFDKLTDEPIFSVPYQDSFGLGMMTTAAVPVKYNHVLKGVVGVDITLTDLLEEVTFFTGGQNSYALVFEVDTYAIGRTLLHPLLPSPLVIEDEPVYVHITSLEREQEFYDRVYNYATNDGTFGNATFTSRRYISRGNQRTEGVNKMSVLSTYHWRRVIGSNYIVCLVEAVDFDVVELFGQGPKASADDFVYHRLDIVPPDTSCKYVNRLATKEQSTVKFAPRAFSSPAQYLQYEETESIVEQYQNYMMDASSINTHFKDRVRDAVIVTAKVNEIWKSEDADMYKHYTLFRYMGTRNGVYRQLPGITMSKVHDTTVRPWYERAKSNADILTLSVPYADANGAGEVIALSKAITESLSSTSTSSNVLAVMGMDFTISYFYNMLTKHYPECEEFSNSCFVMDSSGFLVIHRDFTESDSDVSDIHIMEKEPNVAEDLLEKRILKKKQCVDFQKIKNLNYYIAERVGSTATIDNMNNANKCKRYRLAHVQDTNVYLGIVYKATGCNQHCPCYYETCMHTSADNECECPCLSPTEYEYCKDQFSFTSDDDPTCLPPRPSISPVIEDTDAYTGLGECYNANCTSKQAAR
ncbi:VWFA and cache domain-containing protein 1-like [Saccoglossus kowalevskii]